MPGANKTGGSKYKAFKSNRDKTVVKRAVVDVDVMAGDGYYAKVKSIAGGSYVNVLLHTGELGKAVIRGAMKRTKIRKDDILLLISDNQKNLEVVKIIKAYDRDAMNVKKYSSVLGCDLFEENNPESVIDTEKAKKLALASRQKNNTIARNTDRDTEQYTDPHLLAAEYFSESESEDEEDKVDELGNVIVDESEEKQIKKNKNIFVSPNNPLYQFDESNEESESSQKVTTSRFANDSSSEESESEEESEREEEVVAKPTINNKSNKNFDKRKNNLTKKESDSSLDEMIDDI